MAKKTLTLVILFSVTMAKETLTLVILFSVTMAKATLILQRVKISFRVLRSDLFYFIFYLTNLTKTLCVRIRCI